MPGFQGVLFAQLHCLPFFNACLRLRAVPVFHVDSVRVEGIPFYVLPQRVKVRHQDIPVQPSVLLTLCVEQESPGAGVFRHGGHPVKLSCGIVGRQGISKPYVVFSHDSDRIRPGVGCQ